MQTHQREQRKVYACHTNFAHQCSGLQEAAYAGMAKEHGQANAAVAAYESACRWLESGSVSYDGTSDLGLISSGLCSGTTCWQRTEHLQLHHGPPEITMRHKLSPLLLALSTYAPSGNALDSV